MNPIINSEGKKVCYSCGRVSDVLMTVDRPNVPHAELCSNCMYELALWMEEKENELKEN